MQRSCTGAQPAKLAPARGVVVDAIFTKNDSMKVVHITKNHVK